MTISGPPAVTNDLGEFRIHSLAPGDYYVQASPRFEPPNAQNTPTVTTKIAPTFYPGATDVAGAQSSAIGAGATLTGIEIGLLRAQAFSIRGVVVDEEGRPVANAMVMLTHDPTQGIPTFTPSSQARTAPDGSFAIEGIVNGSYRLSAAAASTSKIERIGVSGGIVSSSGGFGGPVGRVMTETRNGVTSQYLFDPQDEIRITVQGDHLTGVQLIAKRPTP
jgi:protocatechuate 3,4-dioxygenase beta subunit